MSLPIPTPGTEMQFPKTAVLRVRTDLRAVAGIASFFAAQGSLPNSRNGLGGQAIYAFYRTLVRSGAIPEVENTEDAAVILEKLGFAKFVTESMNRRDYGVQVSREDLVESGDSAESSQLEAAIRTSLKKVSNEQA
jgi:hypothetical protein